VLSSHPNSRFCTPASQCPIIAPEWQDPAGVPLSAIVVGGRRASTIPLVLESRNWQHGVFMGATLSSETTAAATGEVGVVRRDPFAMLPFMGYHIGDYFKHWLNIGKKTDSANLPRIYYVNWFRKSNAGKFLWPVFGDNLRVLKWIVDRIEENVPAVETLAGLAPQPADLDITGLSITPADLAAVLNVDADEWRSEVPLISEWFEKISDKLPTEMIAEFETLKSQL
jgi:phosphoenolpyruvate carboxykinase (GTP)